MVLEENTAKLAFNRTNGQLDILSATKDDEGTYACVAYNRAGVETVQVAVIIHIKATITSQVSDVKVGLGSVGNLYCSLLASPPVDRVDWFKAPSSIRLPNTTKHTYYLNGMSRTDIFSQFYFISNKFYLFWHSNTYLLQSSVLDQIDLILQGIIISVKE